MLPSGGYAAHPDQAKCVQKKGLTAHGGIWLLIPPSQTEAVLPENFITTYGHL